MTVCMRYWPSATAGLGLLLWLAVSGYALLTLQRLRQGRRPNDPARAQWRRALLCLLAAGLLALAGLAWPEREALPLLTGFLWLGGLGLGVMLAMLGKIVPFLCWLHLKAAHPPRGLLPSTHGFLSEPNHARIGWLHALWLGIGAAWCLAPQPTQRLFAAATALLAAALAYRAARIARRHVAIRHQIEGAARPLT